MVPPMSIPPFFTRMESNRHQSEPLGFRQSDGDRLENVQVGKQSRGRWLVEGFVEPLRAVLGRFALSRGILAELRSLLPRIALQYKRSYNLHDLDVGPFHERLSDGHLRWNTCTHACSAHIESFVAAHLWATMIDLEVYRNAWEKGAEWGIRSYCNSGRENSSRETSVNPEISTPRVDQM
jgi:hypothetical protein